MRDFGQPCMNSMKMLKWNFPTMALFPCAVDLVPDNLPELLNLLADASPEWLELGLQLRVRQTTLRVIERDYDKTRRCFMEMLSEWLKMIDPLPSWERLFAALEQPSVGREDLVEVVKKEIGVGTPVESDDSDESGWGKQYMVL